MKIIYASNAMKEYQDWQKSSKFTADKIDSLISDIIKNGLDKGIGKPEKLKHYKHPVRFSRMINKIDRLVYFSDGKDLFVLSCKGHYDDH